MAKQYCRWHVYPDARELYDRAASAIARMAARSLEDADAFRIVLAGGNTPREVYQRLARMTTDWLGWHVYFGDERCLPPDHPERNSAMARAAWLDHVSIPRGQIHPIPAEQGPEAGARAYADLLAGVGMFDLVLLGLGEDGHTASLFPGQDWGLRPAQDPAVLPVFGAPKAPAERVSLSAWRLSETKRASFLVTGEGKRPAVARWLEGEVLPARAIAPAGGVDVLLERVCFVGSV